MNHELFNTLHINRTETFTCLTVEGWGHLDWIRKGLKKGRVELGPFLLTNEWGY